MNQLQVFYRKKGKVRLECTEQTYIQIEKLLNQDHIIGQEKAKKAALKNIIPVMFNKFTKWLDSLNADEYQDISDIVEKIDKIKNGRQKMSIKDLRNLCQNESIKDYWLEFLHEGHAKKSIANMKRSANKRLYEQQLHSLIREVQNPTLRNMPYKKFTFQSRNSSNSDNDAEQFQSHENIYYQSS